MQTEIIFSDFSFCFPRNPEERLRKSKVEPLWFPEQKSRLISFPPIFQLCFLPPKEPVLKWSWIQAGRHNFSVPPLISYLNCLTAVPPPDTCGNYFYEPADFVKKDRLPTDSWKKAFLCKKKNFFDLFLWKTPEIKTPPCLDFRSGSPPYHLSFDRWSFPPKIFTQSDETACYVFRASVVYQSISPELLSPRTGCRP